MLRNLILSIVLAGLGSMVVPETAHADATLGLHLGVNFDVDDPLLGAESRIDLTKLGGVASLQIAPSFSYYFTDNIDLWNLALAFPFEFKVHGTMLRPYVGPGLAIVFWEFGAADDTDLMFVIEGGLSFALPVVVPYVGFRALLGGDRDGAELLFGVLFRLG